MASSVWYLCGICVHNLSFWFKVINFYVGRLVWRITDLGFVTRLVCKWWKRNEIKTITKGSGDVILIRIFVYSLEVRMLIRKWWEPFRGKSVVCFFMFMYLLYKSSVVGAYLFMKHHWESGINFSLYYSYVWFIVLGKQNHFKAFYVMSMQYD